jgi:transcriptional regulator with XRE-family HTH domain
MLTGNKLRAIRALRSLSQSQLSLISGVSAASIADFENGKRDLRAKTILRLCEAMKVQIKYVIDGTELSGP